MREIIDMIIKSIFGEGFPEYRMQELIKIVILSYWWNKFNK